MFDSVIVIVFEALLIVLLVNVSVVALPTNVSVDVGNVKVPVLLIDEITGVVSVLLVKVSDPVLVASADASTPSTVSASRPDPVPSTVLIAVSISDAVWSAVAPLSMPSSFVPSVATSLPSTVPVTVMLPVTDSALLATTCPLKVAEVSFITSSVLPSAETVMVPFEPESVTATDEFSCAIDVVETAATESSTYTLVAASVSAVGVPRLIILLESTLTAPVPELVMVMSALDGADMVEPVMTKSPTPAVSNLACVCPSLCKTCSVLLPESFSCRSPRYMVDPVTYRAAHCDVGEPRL